MSVSVSERAVAGETPVADTEAVTDEAAVHDDVENDCFDSTFDGSPDPPYGFFGVGDSPEF